MNHQEKLCFNIDLKVENSWWIFSKVSSRSRMSLQDAYSLFKTQFYNHFRSQIKKTILIPLGFSFLLPCRQLDSSFLSYARISARYQNNLSIASCGFGVAFSTNVNSATKAVFYFDSFVEKFIGNAK